MRILFKKLTAFMLSIAIIFTSISFSAFADEIESEQSILSHEVKDYIDEVLPCYLSANGFYDDKTYSVSLPFEIINMANSKIVGYYVFVLQEDSLIGFIELYYSNTKFYSSFSTNFPEELSITYEQNENVKFVIDNGIIFASTESYSFPMEMNGDLTFDEKTYPTSAIEANREVKYNLSAQNQAYSATLGSKTLSVSFVPNEKVNGKYVLCWAACVAMGVNYVRGKSYSASDIKNLVGTSTGTNSTVTGAYGSCGCPATYNSGACTPTQIFNSLQNGKPVQFRVADQTQGLYHAIEVFSITVYNDKTTYTFYDPSILNGTVKSVTATGNPSVASSTFLYSKTYDGTLYNMSWLGAHIIN